MKTAFQRFLNDIKHGRDIDIYITLFLAILFAVLGIIGLVQFTILSAGILATLGVLASSMLDTRRIISKLSQTITSPYPQADVFLKDRSTFRAFHETLEGVNTLCLCGPGLTALWAANRDALYDKVRNGGTMHVLIFNKASNRLPMFAEQLGVHADRLQSEITTTIENCKELIRGGTGLGAFEVRQTEVILGFSIVIYNPSEYKGYMVVEYLGYKTSLKERPHVQLDAIRDRRWFSYYLNQFNELWKTATPYDF